MADISDTHVPYPGCYCADCVEGTPSARITGDKDRSVQSRAPTDLTTRLYSFAKALETGFDFNVMKHLDVSMCCTGHMCGCQGATVGQYLAHHLRGELPDKNPVEGAHPMTKPEVDPLVGEVTVSILNRGERVVSLSELARLINGGARITALAARNHTEARTDG